MSSAVLIPTISVGEFRFGSTIENHLYLEHTYHPNEPNDPDMEGFYVFANPPLIVFVDNNDLIITVNCKKTCIFKGKELIGLAYPEFLVFTELVSDSRERIYLVDENSNGRFEEVYGFENLGLQLWVRDKKIVTVSCTNYDL